MRQLINLKTDLDFLMKTVFHDRYDREKYKDLAKTMINQLCHAYGGSRVLSETIGASAESIRNWVTRDEYVVIHGAMSVANLYIQHAGICTLMHCKAIYLVFRALVNTKPPSALIMFDDHMDLKLEEMERKG